MGQFSYLYYNLFELFSFSEYLSYEQQKANNRCEDIDIIENETKDPSCENKDDDSLSPSFEHNPQPLEQNGNNKKRKLKSLDDIVRKITKINDIKDFHNGVNHYSDENENTEKKDDTDAIQKSPKGMLTSFL